MLAFARIYHFVGTPTLYFLFDSNLVEHFEQSLLFLGRIIIIILELDILLSLLDPLQLFLNINFLLQRSDHEKCILQQILLDNMIQRGISGEARSMIDFK